MILALVLSLNIFGSGPLLNLPPFAPYDSQALENASAHAGWSLAAPLVGCAVAGRRGAAWVAVAWVGLALVREALAHGETQGPEVRTDLLSHIAPAAIGVAVCHLTKRNT